MTGARGDAIYPRIYVRVRWGVRGAGVQGAGRRGAGGYAGPGSAGRGRECGAWGARG